MCCDDLARVSQVIMQVRRYSTTYDVGSFPDPEFVHDQEAEDEEMIIRPKRLAEDHPNAVQCDACGSHYHSSTFYKTDGDMYICTGCYTGL